jgi:hypothetical protein
MNGAEPNRKVSLLPVRGSGQEKQQSCGCEKTYLFQVFLSGIPKLIPSAVFIARGQNMATETGHLRANTPEVVLTRARPKLETQFFPDCLGLVPTQMQSL